MLGWDTKYSVFLLLGTEELCHEIDSCTETEDNLPNLGIRSPMFMNILFPNVHIYLANIS